MMPNALASDISTTEREAYKAFCVYLQESCGITLGNDKSYLVSSRLKPILEEFSFHNLSQLLIELKKSSSRSLQTRIVDAMTTNETSWFRDIHPFELLKDVILPEISRQPSVKIWSAACSYGHEPYSISIAVEEFLQKNPGLFPGGVDILGTDISTRVLKQAQQAEYDELGLNRGLSPERKRQFFEQTNIGWKVQDKVKRRVRFRELNLLKSFSTLGQIDIIFCRNVLIYFNNESKSDILNKITEILKPNGYLFLGASEPIINYSDRFEMISAGRGVYYQKK